MIQARPCLTTPLWQLLPEDLVDKILLLRLHPAMHACCVCKRWSQLVTSSAFRTESELIAFRRGHRNFVCCKLELALANLKEAGNDGSGGALHKVDMPGATTWIPGLVINSRRLKVFCGAGLVGVAHMSFEGTLDCWLLNVANKTCRQLPRLFLSSSCYTVHVTTQRCRWRPSDWEIWLEPAPESSGSSDTFSSFRVVLMVFHPCAVDAYGWSSPALYTYSSTSTEWRTVCHPIRHPIRPHPTWCSCLVTKGGYLSWFGDIGDSNKCERVRICGDSDCITQLPDPPLGVKLISDPSTAAMFGWRVDESTLSLYRLDESSGWRCLYSGLPPQLHPTSISVEATKILGNMLILVCAIWEYPEEQQDAHCLAMAYHMHDGSCQWFRLPAQAFLYDYMYIPGHKSVFLEPMLVSHLRL